jgi:branched-chain amino acid transport system substrate-binding protein
MRIALFASAVLAVLASGTAAAQDRSVKIGFTAGFSGASAFIGNDERNAFELALDHLGRKMGGLDVEVSYADHEIRPDVGLQVTERLIQSTKVDFLAGYSWSNVLLASLKPAADSKTFLIGIHATLTAGHETSQLPIRSLCT